MHSSWTIILDVLILLTAALVLGMVAEQLRQSAVLGYLLAGTLVGPSGFALVGSGEEVEAIAELGVALLLFTIGLEFSVRRLRRLGIAALIGGSLQVVITLLAAATAAALMGFDGRAALAMGAIVALSSTACVLRLLMDRAALDSVYGRHALGVLLVQDIAVIPLILMVTALSDGDSMIGVGLNLLYTVGLATALIGLFYLVFNFVVPHLFNIRQWVRNRDQPILLAIVVALGAVVAAHQVGISPAMGAFLAGVLLGGSPFAVQMRADVSSVRTLLVTVFFASIGLLGDPGWVMENWMLVTGTVTTIVMGKILIVAGVMKAMRLTDGLAVATGLCLAQVGEFSFVLADAARAKLISEELFRLIISTMIVTLFLTPFFVAAAPHATNLIGTRRKNRDIMPSTTEATTTDESRGTTRDAARETPLASESRYEATGGPHPTIFIIGFGPAGQRVVQALLGRYREQMMVIDLNKRNTATAEGHGLRAQLGDASQQDVLEHARIQGAEVIVVTIPDPNASRTIIHHCRSLAPHASIIVRARYHVLRPELQSAGATEVVDEEDQIGLRLAAEARKHLRDDDGAGGVSTAKALR